MKNIVTRKAEQITNLILIKVVELHRYRKKLPLDKMLENYIFSFSLILVCHYLGANVYDALSINNLLVTPDNAAFISTLKILNNDSEKIRYFLINIENEINRKISSSNRDPYFVYLDLLCLSAEVLSLIKEN